MSQPPDDDFYSSSTEITELPQQDPMNLPNVEQLDFPAPNSLNQPGMEQPGFSSPNPASQPGFNAVPQRLPQQGPFGQPGPQRPPQDFAQAQGPLSQSGFEQPGPSRGPISQPGFAQPGYRRAMDQRGPGPQNAAPQKVNKQDNLGQQRPINFPPPSGPISQPGFSSVGQAQYDQYPTQQAPYPGNNPQSGGTLARNQQLNVPTRSPQQLSTSQWEQPQQPGSSARPPQQSGIPPWQQPRPNSLADWPTVAQPQTPTKPKRSSLMLVVALGALILLVLGSGTFVLFSQKNKTTNPNPSPLKTAVSNRGTPVATHPMSAPTTSTGTFQGINTPVQGGTDWLVTITSVKTTTASLIAPNTGNTYLEIHLALKNTSSKTLTVISIIEFTLTDASGHRYNETATDTNIRRPPDGNINANQTLTAQLAYEVPTTQHTFILAFAYGLGSGNGSSVAWKFTV